MGGFWEQNLKLTAAHQYSLKSRGSDRESFHFELTVSYFVCKSDHTHIFYFVCLSDIKDHIIFCLPVRSYNVQNVSKDHIIFSQIVKIMSYFVCQSDIKDHVIFCLSVRYLRSCHILSVSQIFKIMTYFVCQSGI